MYQHAVTSAETIRRQQVVDRKYVVSYVPPQQPSSSDWFSRLGNVIGVFVGLMTLRFLVGGVASYGWPSWKQSLAVGGVLIVAIVVQMTITLLRRRAERPRFIPQPA